MAQIRKDAKGRSLQKGEIQEKSGRYIYSYTDLTGKRRKAYAWRLLPSDRYPKEYLYEPSLREREEQIQNDLAAGIIPEGKRQTVYQMSEAYVKVREGTAAPTTADAYQVALHQLDEEVFGHRKIGEVTMADAKTFAVHLQDERGLSFSSISNLVGILRPAFDQAVEDGLTRRNPFNFQLKSVIKNDTKHRDALTAEEMADFLAFVKQSKWFSIYYNAFYLQFFTGMRISELCGLTLDDIDFEHHYISVKRQLLRTHYGMVIYAAPTKTRAGVRKIPLMPSAEQCLHRVIESRPKFAEGEEPAAWNLEHTEKTTGFLFFDKNLNLTVSSKWQEHYRHAARAYRKYWPGACQKTITSHVARHTFCSLRVKEGMQPKTLQMIMGHNSIRTTLTWYTHLTDDDVIDEALTLMGSDKSLCSFEDPGEISGSTDKKEIEIPNGRSRPRKKKAKAE